MYNATFEDEGRYGVCPVFDENDTAAWSDAELVEGYSEWNRDHGDFDWEAGINTRTIRDEIVRRAQTEPQNGALRVFAEENGIEVAA